MFLGMSCSGHNVWPDRKDYRDHRQKRWDQIYHAGRPEYFTIDIGTVTYIHDISNKQEFIVFIPCTKNPVRCFTTAAEQNLNQGE